MDVSIHQSHRVSVLTLKPMANQQKKGIYLGHRVSVLTLKQNIPLLCARLRLSHRVSVLTLKPCHNLPLRMPSQWSSRERAYVETMSSVSTLKATKWSSLERAYVETPTASGEAEYDADGHRLSVLTLKRQGT